MPTVSICLPVYNGANYLAKAIESAQAQTFADFELLIADDCSTDETPAIIEKYAKQDRRIKSWRNASNLKLFGNYNDCINKCTGTFIKLFAHDDLFHPTLLERMLRIFNDHPNVSLVTSARCWIDANGEPIKADSNVSAKTMKPFSKDTSLSANQAITGTLTEVVNWLGEPSSQMFLREHADGGYDTSFKQVGDLEYSYRLLQNGDYYYIADELCYFRSHAESWSTNRILDLTAYLDWFLLGSKYQSYLKQAGLTPYQYCLSVIRAITQNLEDRLHHLHRLGREDRCLILKELLQNADPLSYFDCAKGAARKYDRELTALGAIAFLQCVLVENDIRLAHEEVAQEYFVEKASTKEAINAARPDLGAGIDGLKQALRRRDKTVEGLEHNLQKERICFEDLQEKIESLKQALEVKNREIEALRLALDEMGNSLSWKMTEPLRRLKGR